MGAPAGGRERFSKGIFNQFLTKLPYQFADKLREDSLIHPDLKNEGLLIPVIPDALSVFGHIPFPLFHNVGIRPILPPILPDDSRNRRYSFRLHIVCGSGILRGTEIGTKDALLPLSLSYEGFALFLLVLYFSP